MSNPNPLARILEREPDIKTFRDLNWEGTFEDYLNKIWENPRVLRNAYQRLYEMILSYGHETFKENKQTLTRYKFFSDVQGDGHDAVFGLERSLERVVRTGF